MIFLWHALVDTVCLSPEIFVVFSKILAQMFRPLFGRKLRQSKILAENWDSLRFRPKWGLSKILAEIGIV